MNWEAVLGVTAVIAIIVEVVMGVGLYLVSKRAGRIDMLEESVNAKSQSMIDAKFDTLTDRVSLLVDGLEKPLEDMKVRLKSGDAKFDGTFEALAVLRTQMAQMMQAFERHSNDLREVAKQINETFVEGRGAVNQLARDVEKDFVRKSEMRALEEKTDRQHAEVMKAINDIKRGMR